MVFIILLQMNDFQINFKRNKIRRDKIHLSLKEMGVQRKYKIFKAKSIVIDSICK